MRRRAIVTIFMLLGGIWGVTLAARGTITQAPGAPEAFKPVASVHSLMEGQEAHFEALEKLIENKDAKKRFKHITVEAEILAELANVNMHNKDKDDYRAWAKQLRDLSLMLGAEAKKSKSGADEEQFKVLYSQLKKTCMACHDMYQ